MRRVLRARARSSPQHSFIPRADHAETNNGWSKTLSTTIRGLQLALDARNRSRELGSQIFYKTFFQKYLWPFAGRRRFPQTFGCDNRPCRQWFMGIPNVGAHIWGKISSPRPGPVGRVRFDVRRNHKKESKRAQKSAARKHATCAAGVWRFMETNIHFWPTFWAAGRCYTKM